MTEQDRKISFQTNFAQGKEPNQVTVKTPKSKYIILAVIIGIVIIILVVVLLILLLKSSSELHKYSEKDRKDVHSCANFDEIYTEHFHLDIVIDLDEEKISGSQFLKMEVLKNDIQYAYIDIRAMQIQEIYVMNENQSQQEELEYDITPFKLSDNLYLGDKLQINLNSITDEQFQSYKKKGSIIYFKIFYESTKDQSALTFLQPNQTDQKTNKMVFSQCQAINCREFAPLQDTPSVKASYSATVIVADSYDIHMSADKLSENNIAGNLKKVEFELNYKVPSYLLAIIIGKFEVTVISERAILITEPVNTNTYKIILKDMQTYLEVLEDYLGDYEWGTYKTVILPQTYPYGGMEHPKLNFEAPDIMTSDRQNLGTLYHEMAHSWFGNTITCANWSNFWINEGFTQFMESKVDQKLSGENIFKLKKIISKNILDYQEELHVEAGKKRMNKLTTDLSHTNADDGINQIPYRKGEAFVYYLEQLMGEEDFQEFLKDYLQQYKQKSLVYIDFQDYFIDYFGGNSKIEEINWDAWIFGTKLPVEQDYYSNPLLEEQQQIFETVFTNIEQGNSLSQQITQFNDMHFYQKYLFMSDLGAAGQGGNIDNDTIILFEQFNFQDSEHGLIVAEWLGIQIAYKNTLTQSDLDTIQDYLQIQGDRDNLFTVYYQLIIKNKSYAQQQFEANKNYYHFVVNSMIQGLFDDIE